jgi:ribosomal protein L1
MYGGNQVSVRVGRLGMSAAQLSANVQGVHIAAVRLLPRKSRGLDSAHLSLPQSPPFPLFFQDTTTRVLEQ